MNISSIVRIVASILAAAAVAFVAYFALAWLYAVAGWLLALLNAIVLAVLAGGAVYAYTAGKDVALPSWDDIKAKFGRTAIVADVVAE